jgi:hypothetical protein
MANTLTEDQACDLAEMHFALAQGYRAIAQDYGPNDRRRAMLMRKAGDIDEVGMAWLETYKPERIAA